jgi:hypothetical protein
MSWGNPYGTHSLPCHERLVRAFLAMTCGCLAPQSFGWPNHHELTVEDFAEIARRERRLVGLRRLPWAVPLVSEQTRQFHCRRKQDSEWLPPMLGWRRTAQEGHHPCGAPERLGFG